MGNAQNYTYFHSNYLLKAHNFRNAKTRFARRAIVRDYFGERGGEAFAKNGYNNLSKFI